LANEYSGGEAPVLAKPSQRRDKAIDQKVCRVDHYSYSISSCIRKRDSRPKAIGRKAYRERLLEEAEKGIAQYESWLREGSGYIEAEGNWISDRNDLRSVS